MREKTGIELRQEWWGVDKAQATANRRGELLRRLIDSGMLTTNEKLMCQEECEDCDLTREILKELSDDDI